MVEAQVLDREADAADRDRVASELDLGVHDADLHPVTLPRDDGLPS